MIWEAPGWFLLLGLLPLLALRRRASQEPAALPYPSLDLLPESRAARWPAWIGPSARLLALLLITLALAQPRWPDTTTRLPARATAISLVLDVSGSMAETDFLSDGQPPRRRIDAAKEMLVRLIRGDDQLPGRGEDLIALVTFAAQVEDLCPATLSHEALLQFIAQAEVVGTIPDNTTNIGDALAAALELVRRAGPESRCLVLVSDGEHNVRPEVVFGALRPRQAARVAASLGVRIHTILITGPASAATPDLKRQQNLAGESMNDVATMTGGLAFHAEDDAALRQIAAAIDARERTEVAAPQFGQFVELYPALTLAALFVLVLGAVLESLLDRRLP